MPTNRHDPVTPARLIKAATRLARRRDDQGAMTEGDWRATWLATLHLLTWIRMAISDYGFVQPERAIRQFAGGLGVGVKVIHRQLRPSIADEVKALGAELQAAILMADPEERAEVAAALSEQVIGPVGEWVAESRAEAAHSR